jgi:hypothetical protein
VEFEFGLHRFRLHNKHNKVVNPTSGRENWTICHRDEHDGHKRHLLFYYGIAGDIFNIMTFYQLKAPVKYGDHLILSSN